MARAPWRRRRTTDSPRPAGRQWAGRRWTGPLRRSGSLARQVLLVRVGRSGSDRLRFGRRSADSVGRYRVDPLTAAEIAAIAPLSPAIGPVGPAPATGVEDRPITPADHTATADSRPGVLPPAPVPLLPGTPTAARRAGFVLVNSTTLASLTLGLTAIFLAMEGDVRPAAACLIACVVFDGLDGALARRLGVASPFGAQMDSLADMCSFGLAAPVVVYASLAGSVSTTAAAVACALVAGCAAIRLARFNVSPCDGRFFTGVPTTLAAAVLGLGVLIDVPIPGGAQLAVVALLAFAMVSSFPYAKLARLIKLPPWLWVVPVVGALIDARLTFGLTVLAYLVSGPLLWLHQRRAT
ncbi:phosphatidylcholine/phosphatidylserine synthase [Solwaraspora sp. WMMD937]|uniref:CDP-alcohol phosphatidyltransferase family protein n=1 Tax=Solwaraspora sp. WMMD937 TaxID=3016090 RepID=UPI00249C3E62|nr:phosphatidylcholine/phosphatidylserine synthase [Solwaraspora sp. WMMD937]WFE23436.1 phosphatidylcholine/phosphatidylserine synthase [Solwaraspora sp. WMMD937]